MHTLQTFIDFQYQIQKLHLKLFNPPPSNINIGTTQILLKK